MKEFFIGYPPQYKPDELVQFASADEADANSEEWVIVKAATLANAGRYKEGDKYTGK